jgi:16S rRNA U1498 N3-methylase RsmE
LGLFIRGSPKAAGTTQYISTNEAGVNSFFKNESKTTTKEGTDVVLNTVIPFGTVGATAVSKFVELGYDDINPVQYFHTDLKPWWQTAQTKTIEQVLAKAAVDYHIVLSKCQAFNTSLYNDAIKAGGDKYAKLCVLA